MARKKADEQADDELPDPEHELNPDVYRAPAADEAPEAEAELEAEPEESHADQGQP